MYERPADNFDFIWFPRTTFAVSRQLYAETQQCLLKRHVAVRISMRVKPEFRAWMLSGPHTEGWLMQIEDAGAVTRSKFYHMHIQIGPSKKLPLTSILLFGHESLISFCARVMIFSPKYRDPEGLTEGLAQTRRVHVYNLVPRRLRLRITSLKPIESETITRTQERDLYASLLSVWWGFEDVQIVPAVDKESAIRTRKLLSDDKFSHCEHYVEWSYARDVLLVLAIADNRLQVAIQLSRRQQLLFGIMSITAQLTAWKRNAVSVLKLNSSHLRFLMLDFELRVKVAQASESEKDLKEAARQAYIIHDKLACMLDDGLTPDMDARIHINYLLSLCYRYGRAYVAAKECIDAALAECPDDKRLQRERVILKILTNKNFSEQQLREKASEFRKYPVEPRKTDIEFASTVRSWKIPLTASIEEQQDFIMQYVRFRKMRLYPLYS